MGGNFRLQHLVGVIDDDLALFVREYCKDGSISRAGEIAGLTPARASRALQRDDVQTAIRNVMQQRDSRAEINAEWVLYEAMDNHYIARHQGNIGASNAALTLIAKHKNVDALAVSKIDMAVGVNQNIVDRLRRGRQRVIEHRCIDITPEVSFL